jgi:2',3'-cyclic-nucleotide 2'-phosphodiesterase
MRFPLASPSAFDSSANTIEILFFGDLVGKPGRMAVKTYLESLTRKPDMVIANVENASHGFGLSEKNFRDIQGYGVDVMTSGNHIFDRKEIFDYIYASECLLRPANYPTETPGVGARVFEIAGVKVGVINLLGQVFMGSFNSPWEQLDSLVPQMQYETPIIFLDFHAEATAEKVAMAHYAAEAGVSAMVGTHTHVQTGDERLILDRMGYITDAGFNGAYRSVIGFEPQPAIQRLKTHYPTRLEVGHDETLQVNGIRFWVNTKTGHCEKLERLRELVYQTEPALVSD